MKYSQWLTVKASLLMIFSVHTLHSCIPDRHSKVFNESSNYYMTVYWWHQCPKSQCELCGI